MLRNVDYYPGGMQMVGRKFLNGNSYRYSINGQEKSEELNENLTSAEFWEYDTRVVRRWNIDPVSKLWESPYLCFNGSPIQFSDPNGDDSGSEDPVTTKGTNLKAVIVHTVRKKVSNRIIDPRRVVSINTKSTCHVSNSDINASFKRSNSAALAAVNNGKGLDAANGQVALPTTNALLKFANNYLGASDVYVGPHPITGEFSPAGFRIDNNGYVAERLSVGGIAPGV